MQHSSTFGAVEILVLKWNENITEVHQLILGGSYFTDVTEMDIFIKNLPIPYVSFYYLVF